MATEHRRDLVELVRHARQMIRRGVRDALLELFGGLVEGALARAVHQPSPDSVDADPAAEPAVTVLADEPSEDDSDELSDRT